MTGFDFKPWMRPKVLLIAMAALYALAGAALGMLVVASDRDDTIGAAQAEARSFAHLLEEHSRHLFDLADLTLLRLSDRLAAAQPADYGSLLAAAPELSNLMLLTADGGAIGDAAGMLRTGNDLSGRDWVIALRSAKPGTTSVGRAVRDEGTSTTIITAARRLPDGRIAAATIDVENFRHIHHPTESGLAVSIGIETLDGGRLVRRPVGGEGVGTLPIQSAPEGAVTVASAQGGPRLVSYRSLADRGLVVWVSLSEDEILAQWRARSLRSILVMAGALALMIGLAVVLVREWARERVVANDLEALNRELGRSNADLEQFAYVASHDLKEPLRNISSYVQLLQRRYQGKLDSDADAFIGYTVEGVRRMQAIIHELLTYSRIGTGHINRQPVQAGAAVATALGQLKTVIAEAQAAIEVKGPLPVVTADPTQLASLFQNLIGNGIKYRRTEMRPEVTVGVEDRGKEWAFYVRDNGIGIDSQYHHQIFELFKRLHPRAHYHGTGIGLSVCKRVVERHGGHIWVESKPGSGSTFWFALPKAKD